ncbi:cytochrome P450 [Streptomyces tremellae]|uniref:Cytochrome P450 n=1 Tax=Streptomyces tremellae TaxID=1124239 RepID=A0ABP7FSX1_9ACTN
MTTPRLERRTVTRIFSRLRTAAGQADPLPLYESLRSGGSAIPAPWGGVLVTSFRLCSQVLADSSWGVPTADWRARQPNPRWRSDSSRDMGHMLPMLDPPRHTAVRRSVAPMFNRSTLQGMTASIEQTATELVDAFLDAAHRGTADYVSMVSDELPIRTIGAWLELDAGDYGRLRELTHIQSSTQELFPSPSRLADADTATRELRDYFWRLVLDRRENPGTDPVSTWLATWDQAAGDQDASNATVHALAFFVLLASMETTTHLLSSTMRLLLEHPEHFELLRAHPDAIPGMVEETLRYDPPIHMISRIAPGDVELGGVPVRRGEMVQLMIGAAHHDETEYPDPGRFDPGRKTNTLSFGRGIHHCLGASLARLEARAVLSALAGRVRATGFQHSAVWAPRVVLRRLASLQVTAAHTS